MSRQSRARHASRRRARARVLSRPRPQSRRLPPLDPTAPACPHCGSGHIGLLTGSEFAEALEAHGVPLDPAADFSQITDGLPFPYWFCHDCESGGGLVWQPGQPA